MERNKYAVTNDSDKILSFLKAFKLRI